MIDASHLEIELPNFTKWKQAIEAKNVGIEFTVPTNIDTGAIKGKTHQGHTTYTHRANYGTYELKVLEIIKPKGTTYLLKINGSLHKNHFGGANYERFTFYHLQQEIKTLCSTLEIDPREARITNLEIGVNIPLPFAVSPFIHNGLMIHQTTEFIPYDKKDGISLGLTAAHAQYVLKCYDKGLQYNLPTPLFRFEIRYLKMETLQYKKVSKKRIKLENGIFFLSDLQHFDKVKVLVKNLVKCWNEILLSEPEINIDLLPLTIKERELFLFGRNRNEWIILHQRQTETFKKRRQDFKKLIAQYGNNIHAQILALIKTEWQILQTQYPILPSGKEATPQETKNALPNFTIKVKGNIGYNLKRYCKTCRRDISEQKTDSIFCGEKKVGYTNAHRCRNIDSNKRNNYKRKYGEMIGQISLFAYYTQSI